jgi:hypothetical protein
LVNHVTAALLDLANIVGGFLLAAMLLSDLRVLGSAVARVARAVAPARVVIGVLALVVGGYYLIVHLVNGPRVFHFELVGIGVGAALLRDRLFAGADAGRGSRPAEGRVPGADGSLRGGELLLAVFGLVAIIVGIQGLFTPD